MSRVRHDSFPALQIPFDGYIIATTCIEKLPGGVDTDAKHIMRMSLERMQNAPVVKIPQYRSFVVTSTCLLYTSPSPRDGLLSRMPSSA